jgi:hypothetical protein
MAKRSRGWAAGVRWTEREAASALAAARASGLSLRQFARRNGFDPQRLYWWQRRLQEPPPGAAPAFIEVERDAAASRVGMEVVLRSGRVVRVPPSFDPGAVRRLVELLE